MDRTATTETIKPTFCQMKALLLLLVATSIISCSPTRYYIVRHAEKAAPGPGSNARDPELSAAGKERAATLANELSGKKIRQVFVTNTIRAKSTAAPSAAAAKVEAQVYSGAADSAFIAKLRNLKGNTLIVGHSNTVDDIVNMLTRNTDVKTDLPESSFDKLFIVTFRKGHYQFTQKTYGIATP